jgi:hypothetical protein
MAAVIPLNGRVQVTAGTGTVRFVGQTAFAAGKWVGIQLDEPTGKNDGSVAGTRYFTCADGYGVFVRASMVSVLDQGGPVAEQVSRDRRSRGCCADLVAGQTAAAWRPSCVSCFDAHCSIFFSTADPSSFVCLCDDETESLPRAGDICPCSDSFRLAPAVSSFVQCIRLVFSQPATFHFADETATIARPVCRLLLSTRFGCFTNNNGCCREAHLDAPAADPKNTNRRSSTAHSKECFRSTGNRNNGSDHPVDREKGPARQLCTTICGTSFAIACYWKRYDSEACATRCRVHHEFRERGSSRSRKTGRSRKRSPHRTCVKSSRSNSWRDYASDPVLIQQPLVDFERREQCRFDFVGTKDSSAGLALAEADYSATQHGKRAFRVGNRR